MKKKYTEFSWNEFPEYLRFTRERLGLKQVDFAKLVKMSPDVYRKYELSDRHPQSERGDMLLEALETYENEVYFERIDKAIELLQDMKMHRYIFIKPEARKNTFSKVAKFLSFVDTIY